MPSADLRGRTVIVTGASRGIGLETSRALAEGGARVVLVARDRAGLEEAAAGLAGGGHEVHPMDVADPGAWPGPLDRVKDLHGLVTAAAVLDPIGPTASLDAGEVLDALRVNLMGTFMAIQHALPRLASSGGSIVTFSGGGATGPLPRYDAYAMSKAAVVRLTENVAADEPLVRANCVAPGFVATGMHQATLDAGEELVGASYLERTKEQLREGGADIGRAAELVAFLLSGAAEDITGKLLSAPWDPWDEDGFRARLAAEPDLCTLRRIDDQAFRAVDSPGG